MILTLTTSARSLETGTNYIGLNQKVMIGEREPDFLTQVIEKEVKQLNLQRLKLLVKRIDKKKLKTFKKIALMTLATSASIFMLVHPTVAAAATSLPVSNPIVTVPTVSNPLLPDDIKTIGLYLIGIIAVVSTIAAIIMTQLSGLWKMVSRKKADDANKWTQEIMKGYIQVLLSPVIILVLAFIVYLLFQNFPLFAKPF